jgi:hypothetical protein
LTLLKLLLLLLVLLDLVQGRQSLCLVRQLRTGSWWSRRFHRASSLSVGFTLACTRIGTVSIASILMCER